MGERKGRTHSDKREAFGVNGACRPARSVLATAARLRCAWGVELEENRVLGFRERSAAAVWLYWRGKRRHALAFVGHLHNPSLRMKFGKNIGRVVELSDPEWSPFWINYKFLKKKAKVRLRADDDVPFELFLSQICLLV